MRCSVSWPMSRMKAAIAGFTPSCTSGTRAFLPTTRNVSHAATPFDGEAEGQPRLGLQARTGPPGLARTDAVHDAERTRERLTRGVAVSHRDLQQRPIAGQHLGTRNREPPAPDVLRERNPRQRGEQPPEVVLRRHHDPRQVGHLDPLIKLAHDVLHGLVHPLQHRGLLPFRSLTSGRTHPAGPDILCPVRSGAHKPPTARAGCDRASVMTTAWGGSADGYAESSRSRGVR